MSHPFKIFIERYTEISSEVWGEVKAKIQSQQIPKGTLLLSEGDVCQHLYFVESGFLRFFEWHDGEDITKFFTESPYTFTSQRSFILGEPAKENIQALTDCIIWSLHRSSVEQLENNKQWRVFAEKIKEEVQFFTESIYTNLQRLTAEERYQYMLEKRPRLIQQVPQHYIASFLGIAPQSLSRIRKKLT